MGKNRTYRFTCIERKAFFLKKDAPVISFLGDLNVVFAIKRAEDAYEILKDNMLPPECDIIELYHKSCENLEQRCRICNCEYLVWGIWDRSRRTS